jgi:uncharacterized protein (TIGR02118 family)
MHQPRFDDVTTAATPSRRAVLRGVGLGIVAAALLAVGWRVDATAQDATPAAAIAEPNPIVVLFGPPTDVAAFEEHYLTIHRPLALQMPGLLEILGGPVLGNMDGTASDYQRIAILRYASQADMETSLSSPEGQEAFGDVQNFATGGVTVFLTHLEAPVRHSTPLHRAVDVPATLAAGTPSLRRMRCSARSMR